MACLCKTKDKTLEQMKDTTELNSFLGVGESAIRNMMKRSTLAGALLMLLPLLLSCSRKPAQTAPPPPEVLVTTVQPRDVPRVLERVSTLDGCVTAHMSPRAAGRRIAREHTR